MLVALRIECGNLDVRKLTILKTHLSALSECDKLPRNITESLKGDKKVLSTVIKNYKKCPASEKARFKELLKLFDKLC